MITIDDREIVQHGEEIKELLKTPYKVERMDSADYAFLDRNGNPVGVERCEIGNLNQKIHSGELEQQITRMVDAYNTVILLVEGVYDQVDGLLAHYKKSERGYFRVRVEPFTRYADVRAVTIRLSELGIELLETPNFACSMLLMDALFKNRTKPEASHTMFKSTRKPVLPTKLTSNPAVPRLLALCPRLGEKVAIRLINQYGSIWAILNTAETELLQVEGFGKTSLTNLKKGVGKE
jgi:ERCC4-type nuclease